MIQKIKWKVPTDSESSKDGFYIICNKCGNGVLVGAGQITESMDAVNENGQMSVNTSYSQDIKVLCRCGNKVTLLYDALNFNLRTREVKLKKI